jgi:Ca-activated chloride channel family protein
MRISLRVIILGFILLGLAGFSQTQKKKLPTFSVSTNLVEVPISVFDEHGRMMTDLYWNDFRIREDRVPQQILSFGLDQKPVSIVMLLDTSFSEKKEKHRIRDSARDFTKALSQGDRLSVITFDDEVRLLQDWTDNMKRVRKKLGDLQQGFRTALYDAMYLSASEQLKDVEGRKAIILLTDCLNNESRVSFQEAMKEVIRSQASFYVVSKTAWMREQARQNQRVIILNDIYRKLFGDGTDYIDSFFAKRESEMANLAKDTGGRSFFPEDYDEVKHDYVEIAREMKSMYRLTYISSQTMPPNSYHEITVECLRPHGRMNYRKGYYYKPEKPQRSDIFMPSIEAIR